MTKDRNPFAAVLLGLIALGASRPMAAVSPANPGGTATVASAGPPDYVLLRFSDAAGRQAGGGERREAVTQALLASAASAHVLICHHGAAGFGGTRLDQLCADPVHDVPPLWWDAAIAINRGAVTTVTVSLQLALGDSPPKKAPPFFLLPPVTLPADLGAGETEGAALREISAQLAAMPAIAAWFRQTARQPGMMRASLVEQPPTAPPPTTAAEPPPYDPAAVAQAADDDDAIPAAPALEAGSAATSGDAAARPEAATKAGPARAPRQEKPTASSAEKVDADFEVRQAIVGQGFGLGNDGRLHVGAEGVSFSRRGQSSPEWTIRWRDLAAAAKDEGLWDAPFPLALRERGGTSHFIVRIDAHGRYVDGTPLLAAITRGRRSAPAEAAPASGPQR
ncbi:MAG TPA: hypothetical protein VGM86_22260 [Thermoanaerobaculia bacterium]|jgi:hypothetical protein